MVGKSIRLLIEKYHRHKVEVYANAIIEKLAKERCIVPCELVINSLVAERKDFQAILDTEIKKINTQPSFKLSDLKDTLISHNEIVSLWYEVQSDDVRESKLVSRGMFWYLAKYYDYKVLKIFGTVPENIDDSDTINILIELPENVRTENDNTVKKEAVD